MYSGIAADRCDRWRVVSIQNSRSLSIATIAEIDPSSIPAIAIAAFAIAAFATIVPVVFPYDRWDR